MKKTKGKSKRKVIMLGLCMTMLVSFPGCGNKENEKEPVQSFIEAENISVTDTSSNNISFPARYENIVENVKFSMDITVDTDLAEEMPVTAKAWMKKADAGKAFDLLFRNNKKYDTYEYEEKDEYGKNVKTGTYVSPEETTLSYGSVSSRISYMQRTLMPYIRSAFILDDEDDRYNADLYSKEAQLSFMSREDALGMVRDILTKINVEFEYDYTGYALDHVNLQSQEYHEDMDGNIDRAQYKKQWAVSDEGYYFCINQRYRGLPLYHVYCEIFSDVKDANAPVQAFVSTNGIEYLDVEKVFELSEEKTGISLLPIDAIAKTVADKYTQILGNSEYEMTNAELYYYVDLLSGMGIYDVKPVWIIKGMEKSGEKRQIIQVIIDAQTAKEIVP